MPLYRAARLQRRLLAARRALLASSKQSIMWLLLLLVTLFVAGMWVLSSLNLSLSQQALAQLRRAQIEQIFLAGVERISVRQQLLEQQTQSLARSGEQAYRQWQRAAARGDDRVEPIVRAALADFTGVWGAGLWFEPDLAGPAGMPRATYLYHASPEQIVRLDAVAAAAGDYRRQPWFAQAFSGAAPGPLQPGERPRWTPVYFNALTDRAVLTVVAPMFSPQGQLIGMATTDWESEQIIDLVSRVEVTANSFSFLIDRNQRRLSGLSREDALAAERILDAIVAQPLTPTQAPDPAPRLAQPGAERRPETRTLDIDGRRWLLQVAGTPAGMVFGVGVPVDEIDAVLAPMRESNHRILVIVGLIMLLLAGWLIYRISALMRELQASYTDSLTGLGNRARLLQALDRSRGATLVLINLDRFREVNSLFGHDCGDAVLRALAQRLQAFVAEHRRGRHVRLYRVGGDEFALLGPALTRARLSGQIQPLIEFLQRQRVYWQDQEIGIGATVGVACRRPGAVADDSGRDGERPDSLLSQATVALKLARQQHLSYRIYDTAQQVERLYAENLIWARRLKAGLAENRVLPWFQPIRDNRSGRVEKFECLVRLEELDGTIVSPSRFLDVAHRLRLDRQITRLMIDKSFAAFRDRPGEFSLNLSYADLQDQALLGFITERLERSGLGPRLIFEILESDGLGNYSEMQRFIETVRPWGCRIAIDDFGTGYSNFEHLLRLNVDLIKIDGSLIRHLPEDRTARLVTRGIVQFARSLGISTVAEFVHSEEVQREVVALGIDFSQGRLIGMAGARPRVTPPSGS